MADTGAKFGGTASTTGSGFTGWGSPNNVFVNDTSYSLYTCGNYSVFTQQTGTLKVTNFSAGIPSGATIDGVEVVVAAFYQSGLRPAHDYRVQLFVGGSAQGDNQATLVDFTTTEAERTYGGATDKWGLTTPLSVANLNDSAFGIEFVGEGNFSGANQLAYINVDYITVKIYYTASGGTTHNLDAVSKTVTMAKNAASLGVVRRLDATSKTLAFNKGTASLNISPAGNVVYSLNAVSKLIDFTPNIASLGVVRRLNAVSKTLFITKNTAIFQRQYNLNAVSKSLPLTKGQSSLTVARKLNALSKSLTFTRNAAGLTVTRRLSAVSRTLSFSRSTASLSVVRRLNAANKALAFTRNMGTLTVVRVGGTTYSLNAVSKALSFNQSQSLLTVRRSMNAVSQTFILTAHQAVFTLDLYNHEQEVCREVFDLATVTGICNRALALVGMSAISSLVENTTEARACETFYNQTRRSLMQAVPWGFLRIQRSLALLGAEAGTPENLDGMGMVSEYGWLYTYAYPCDCLEATMILPSSDGVIASQFSNTGALRDSQNSIVPFVQGTWANPSGGYKRVISTNKQNAILIYQGNITDPSVYPDDFVTLIETTIAAQLATQQGLTNASYYVQQAANSLAQLKAKHAIEYNTDRKPLVYDPVSEFISVRG